MSTLNLCLYYSFGMRQAASQLYGCKAVGCSPMPARVVCKPSGMSCMGEVKGHQPVQIRVKVY